MYSQSRTKAIRKGRHAGVNQRSVHQRGAKHRNDKDIYDSIYINEVSSKIFSLKHLFIGYTVDYQ